MSKETFYEEPQLINPLVSFDQDATASTLYIIALRKFQIGSWPSRLRSG
jgi:hypothetical protein